MKLLGLLKRIVTKVWNALCILCRSVVGRKNTTSTSKMSQKHVWKGAGVLPQDFTSRSSATPGEPKVVDADKLRKLGL